MAEHILLLKRQECRDVLSPNPTTLGNPPNLSGRRLEVDGCKWHIEQLGVWPSAEGQLPNLDILCRLSTTDGSQIHSVMVEVDPLCMHLPDPPSDIARALERKLHGPALPLFVYLDCTNF